MRRIWAILAAHLLLIALMGPAYAGSARDECEGDQALDLSLIEGRLEDSDDGRVWTFVIETCEAFTPADLNGVDGGEHYAMSLHFDTAKIRQGRFERTLEIWACAASTDQVCATMWAGHSNDRYYGGSRKVGDADAAQASPTSVEVSFPNRWLGKKARDRSGFDWRTRTADETVPGTITFDYAPDGPLVREHP